MAFEDDPNDTAKPMNQTTKTPVKSVEAPNDKRQARFM